MSIVPHYLPEWALYIQAIGTPLVTGFAVIYFGWWQQRIAKEKLRHDLFDRRVGIYSLVVALESASRNLNDLEAIYKASVEVDSAVVKVPFLFDAKIAESIGKCSTRFMFLIENLRVSVEGSENKIKTVRVPMEIQEVRQKIADTRFELRAALFLCGERLKITDFH